MRCVVILITNDLTYHIHNNNNIFKKKKKIYLKKKKKEARRRQLLDGDYLRRDAQGQRGANSN